ncbi:MAG: DUF4123 domain-containing protein [Desulfamplus sp.]|nr:DUF4123 domain-containing protein [Desulfamplus sp.]
MESTDNSKTIKATSNKERILNWFQSLSKPLFAILDAARDEEILGHIYQGKEHFAILFEGEQAEELIGVGPYLVAFSKPSDLLESIIEKGWGNSWGIFISSDADFKTLLTHFRQLLIVQLEEGEQVYFRYYDPRVLRVYLPTCDEDQLQQLFGPVHSFSMEDEEKNLQNFTLTHNGLQKNALLQIH